ncbi:glutathione peroxidase [Moraxella bovis]|uniref:glutathione peroxidase n=1 Tax=Moraxella bovis TaxID=476 RepID=UPI0022265EC2|nr:glutathione peroxidase [Moraxella bovis]UYZ67398.1 glutathione peroxidase [Moraxella bovis]UYZ69761.1 glutathione peroxidase [Moraxella bovis]UYZ74321.1 glutathione peroxidase [Moraxella bovis]UZA13042.1 glutathione peroxidase [Moraxella bovis]UZA28617.1 glutathione peroxidase [Moraxella bovis]
MSSIYEFSANDFTGNVVHFKGFEGKVLLIVNTASKCGFTPQFAGLQELHTKYHDKGLVVIGFPCNQFGTQEPHEGAEIGEFCQKNYGVDFLMMDKVDVNGDRAHPIFDFLKHEQGGILTDAIKWNFTKFLVGRDGKVLDRYAPTTKPQDLEKDIEAALA